MLCHGVYILYCVQLQALTVLDYMVAHGSERVIDDIKEHAYQISVTVNAFLLLSLSIDFNAACEELDMSYFNY